MAPRITLAIAALLAALATAVPAQAHEYFPPDATPAWFSETMGSRPVNDPPGGPPTPCVTSRFKVIGGSASNPGVTTLTDAYGFTWGDTEGSSACTRLWGIGESGETRCEGGASHTDAYSPNPGEGGLYEETGYFYSCDVRIRMPDGKNVSCSRYVKNNELKIRGYEDQQVEYADPGWESESSPADCRSLLPGWPNMPLDLLLCKKAKRTLRKAKHDLRVAETPKAKRKARRRIRRTKEAIKENCVVHP